MEEECKNQMGGKTMEEQNKNQICGKALENYEINKIGGKTMKNQLENAIKVFDKMKKSNLFFYEDIEKKDKTKRLLQYKKFLQDIDICSSSNFKFEIIEFLMWINEFTFNAEIFFGGISDLNYSKVLHCQKQIIFDAESDVLETIKRLSHICDYKKYGLLHDNILSLPNPQKAFEEMTEEIASFYKSQFEEASDFINKYQFDTKIDRNFLNIVQARMRDFFETDPLGNIRSSAKNSKLELASKNNNIRSEFKTIKHISTTKSLARMFLTVTDIDDIYNKINERVYKQEDAKKRISVMFYNHMMRLANPDVDIEKRNYLMFGPTGCGKTEIVRVLQEISPVPVIVIDGAVITGAGWRGASLSDLLFWEKQMLNEDKSDLIEGAIVFIDEADKFCKIPTIDSDNFSFSKQASVLKAIEDGCVIHEESKEKLNLNNVTYILAGAFDGLFDKDENDFSVNIKEATKDIPNKDIEINNALGNFGMFDELTGRVSNLIELHELSVNDIVYILKNYKTSAICRAKNLYGLSGIELVISDKAIEEAAKLAYDLGLGVRGANSIINKAIDAKSFDALKNNKKEIRITQNSLSA